MTRKFTVIVTIIVMMVISRMLQAGSDETQPENQGHHDESHHHNHHIGLFGGFTNDLDEHNDFTLGLDYVYRLPVWEQRLGMGAFGEVIFAEHKEYLLGIPLMLKPAGNLFFVVAPGIVIVEEESTDNHFLFRLGAGYEIDLRNISLTPTVNLDFVEGEESLVFGISLGKGF